MQSYDGLLALALECASIQIECASQTPGPKRQYPNLLVLSILASSSSGATAKGEQALRELKFNRS